MATTVHEPSRALPELGDSGNNGRNLFAGDQVLRTLESGSPPPAAAALWVGIAAITMMFAAFTSALVVRQGAAMDWRHFALPKILYLNTFMLFASSITLEVSRRRVRVAGPASGPIQDNSAL